MSETNELSEKLKYLINEKISKYKFSKEGDENEFLKVEDVRKMFFEFGAVISEVEMEDLIVRVCGKQKSVELTPSEVLEIFTKKIQGMLGKEMILDCFKMVSDEESFTPKELLVLLEELAQGTPIQQDIKDILKKASVDSNGKVILNDFVNKLYE